MQSIFVLWTNVQTENHEMTKRKREEERKKKHLQEKENETKRNERNSALTYYFSGLHNRANQITREIIK